MSLDGFFATLDRFILAVRDFFGITPTSLCPLHTCDDDGFFATLDRFILAVRDFFGITPTSLCPLHTCDELSDEPGDGQGDKAGDGFGILVADNAAMVTLVELEGSLRLVGPEEYEAVCEGLSQTLATPLSREGHALQMVFSCDPEEGRERVRRALAPHRTSAKNLDLALLKVLDDWEGTLGRYCASEQAFLALHPDQGGTQESLA